MQYISGRETEEYLAAGRHPDDPLDDHVSNNTSLLSSRREKSAQNPCRFAIRSVPFARLVQTQRSSGPFLRSGTQLFLIGNPKSLRYKALGTLHSAIICSPAEDNLYDKWRCSSARARSRY